MDIYDIPIAIITDQYLEYIEIMKSMNIDVAGDFILMASTLIQIKSKMLLPVHKDEKEDDDDPRIEITRPLLEYLELKSAAQQLAKRDLLDQDVFSRPSLSDNPLKDTKDEIIQVGLFQLIDAFKTILENAYSEHNVDLSTDNISVKEKITEIIEILEKKNSTTLNELFTNYHDKGDMIATFLAVLEMVKLSLLKIVQHTQTGVIRLFYI